MLKGLNNYAGYGPLAIRLTLGLLFVLHGLSKFGVLGGGSLDGTIKAFTMMGQVAPQLTAPLVAAIELLGGVALILGLGTRIAALLLAIIIAVAILTVKLRLAGINPLAQGSWEVDLVYFGGLIALLLQGGGALALDNTVPGPTWLKSPLAVR